MINLYFGGAFRNVVSVITPEHWAGWIGKAHVVADWRWMMFEGRRVIRDGVRRRGVFTCSRRRVVEY
ncbi:hypothetical protein A5699_05535 [Mycobacterium sp. E802]|nr:hypothetical protein A5699_05535 [Mycobacterium sp. E802]